MSGVTFTNLRHSLAQGSIRVDLDTLKRVTVGLAKQVTAIHDEVFRKQPTPSPEMPDPAAQGRQKRAKGLKQVTGAAICDARVR